MPRILLYDVVVLLQVVYVLKDVYLNFAVNTREDGMAEEGTKR